MVILIAPFDLSLPHVIKKELKSNNVSRIDVITYPDDDLTAFQDSFNGKLRQVIVEGSFEDIVVRIAEHISNSKNSYQVLLTQYSPNELIMALMASFAVVKNEVNFVMYIKNDRLLIDGNLFKPSTLEDKELLILKAIDKGMYKVEDIAEFSETSIATVSRKRRKFEEEGYITEVEDKYEVTLKGKIALTTSRFASRSFSKQSFQKVEKLR